MVERLVLTGIGRQQEPTQLEARRLLATHDGEQNVFCVNDRVRVELVRVLKRLCGVDCDPAMVAITPLCWTTRHDFPDAVIAVKNASMACDCTASFDKAPPGLPSMRVI